ncbi:MAG: outer membrane beta-barrel protein [Bdellovibrionales bacterium]
MYFTNNAKRSFLIVSCLLAMSSPAHAYGPEGLFGGRAEPDGSIAVARPTNLKNDRPDRAESVLEHARPDYDPVPVEFGSFEMYPSLELGENYESNLFATDGDEREDVHGIIRPVVNLFSNWGRHALSITTFGDFAYYSQNPDENYQSMVVDAAGRYDILNRMWVEGRMGHQYLAESRTSPNDVNGRVPVTFNLSKAGMTFYRGVGSLHLTLDYDFKRFRYDDTPAAGGAIDQSLRSRDEHKTTMTWDYAMTGNVSPYLRASYETRPYTDYKEHDATGYEALAGTTVDMGGITSLDVYAGWMVRDYDDFATTKHLSSPRVGGRIDWNPTGLTSVVLEANRTLEETSITNYNSYYATGGSVTVTHELYRNILLEGNLGFSRYDFNGSTERQDDVLGVGCGTRYLISRNLYTDAMYNWEGRESSEVDNDYARHLVMMRVGIHY